MKILIAITLFVAGLTIATYLNNPVGTLLNTVLWAIGGAIIGSTIVSEVMKRRLKGETE